MGTGAFTVPVLTASVAAAMTAVHKKMHDQAAADQNPRQGGDHVSLVFGPEEISGNGKETEQGQAGFGEKELS